MRKLTKSICLLLTVAVMAMMLMACSGGANNQAAGEYKGVYIKLVGDGDEGRVTDEEFSLELKKSGKGVFHRDGGDYDVTWKLDGENFTMSESFAGMTVEYMGTLKDGVLDIFNGDPANAWSYEYYLEKAE